jgi:pimeloyl-ACP methyl ester carboxylesterase
MPTTQANGINIYYEIAGDGDPILLISGLGYGLWQWHKMVGRLAEHFKVITFDNRGAGGTDKPPGAYTAKMLADDTAGLLDAIGIEKAIVMGHSMGGYVAQELALSYPEKVYKLVLASTNFGGPNHIPISQEVLAILLDPSGDPVERVRRGAKVAFAPGFAETHPELLDEIIAYRFSNPIPAEAYQSQLQVGLGLLSLEACFEPRLKNLQAPTFILFGEYDETVPVGNADLLGKAIPNSTVHILPAVGHLFPLEAPDLAVETLVKLLT